MTSGQLEKKEPLPEPTGDSETKTRVFVLLSLPPVTKGGTPKKGGGNQDNGKKHPNN